MSQPATPPARVARYQRAERPPSELGIAMTPSASRPPASQFVTTAIEGTERLGGHDADTAAEAWEGALRLAGAACDDPSRARIFLGLGALRLGGPAPHAARAAAIRAEASTPPALRPGADRLLGSEAAAHLMAGRPRTACGARSWLGRRRHLAGDADGARACWTRAVSTGTDASVAAPLIGLAILSLDEGRPDDAADALCQATWLLGWWHGRDDPSARRPTWSDAPRRSSETPGWPPPGHPPPRSATRLRAHPHQA